KSTISALEGGGLIVLPSVFTTVHCDLIIAEAARHRVPAIYPFRHFAISGGLMSYGNLPADVYRQAAVYVDRILRGAQPADLPVQAPTKFRACDKPPYSGNARSHGAANHANDCRRGDRITGSRQRSTSVAFGAKRTLMRALLGRCGAS